MATRWPRRPTRRTNRPAWMATTFAFQEFGRVPRICSRVLGSAFFRPKYMDTRGDMESHSQHSRTGSIDGHGDGESVGWVASYRVFGFGWGRFWWCQGWPRRTCLIGCKKWQDMGMDGENNRVLGFLRSCPEREGLDQQQLRSIRKMKCNFGLIFGWWMLGCLFRVQTASVCLPGIGTGRP